MKKLLLTLAVFLTLFSACSGKNNRETTAKPTPENITYRVLDPSPEPDYCEIDWENPEPDEVYAELYTLARGHAQSVNDVSVSYKMGGEDCVNYFSVIEFVIDSVYYDATGSFESGKSMKVFYFLSSYLTTEDAVAFKSGEEYVLFLRPIEGWSKNSLGLENIADYTIIFPMSLIVEESEESYNAANLAEIFLEYGGEIGGEEIDYEVATLSQLEALLMFISAGKS